RILTGYIDDFAVGPKLHSFWLRTDLDGMQNLAGADIDNACQRIVLIRDIQLSAVFAEIEILRVRTALDRTNDFVLGDIKNTDAVRAAVRWRQSAFVDTRRRRRRTTERHIDRPPVRTGVNAARPLAQSNRIHHLEV